MHHWLETTKQKIQLAQDLQALKNIMLEIQDSLSCDFIFYNIQLSHSFEKKLFISVGNFPQKWIQLYIKNDYANIDPVLKHCLKNNTPVYWSTLFDHNDSELHQFFEEAKGFGLVDGISSGLQQYDSEVGILSIAKKTLLVKNDKFSCDIKTTISVLQPYIHDTLVRVSPSYHEYKKSLLTKREKECLERMVEGKTSIEIAVELRISENTVIFHIKNILEKLDSKNRTQAVARAVLIGIVSSDNFNAKQQNSYHWQDI